MGTTKLCIDINQQTWAFVLPPKKNFHTLLRLFPVLSFYENHVNTTKTLEKRQKLTYKGFTDKAFKYTPIYWDKCQAKSGKLMFMANYSIVDWGPHGIWVSNCSDGINSSVCGYATQVAWKVTNNTMEHYHEKDFLAGVTAKWHLLAPKSSSINRLGLNNGTSGNLLRGRTWDLDWTFHRDQL